MNTKLILWKCVFIIAPIYPDNITLCFLTYEKNYSINDIEVNVIKIFLKNNNTHLSSFEKIKFASTILTLFALEKMIETNNYLQPMCINAGFKSLIK